ncbi:Crp/Fnr family transcriptional regulator [Bacillus sp. H-16]|uniref:Crp/Fnr family transcriptional regulator n=1 Tax=Alteribacter salitolerans TaxID=2912333 RepID=UPI001965D436|nr:Crp/Fnr family transcriptional regulator [Alteribacter salitolerans]MBM7095210.1 Crp/Fnr family transcriptional regulator [Alteribacter salitolerans]
MNTYILKFDLDPVIPARLREHMTVHDYKKGEKICEQGEAIDHLYLLVEGKIKIFTSSAEGKILVLCFKKPLEAIGDVEYVRKSAVINTVEAVTPVRVLKMPYRAIDESGASSVPFLQFLLRVITEKLHTDSNFTNFNLLHPVETRLASYLLSVSPEGEDNPEELSNMVDVANLLGTSYRHLNRVINTMIKEKWIERKKGYITILDRESLRKLADPVLYE